MSRTPNFTGWHALILHRADANTDRLERQLQAFAAWQGVRG